jgi:L-asparaginase
MLRVAVVAVGGTIASIRQESGGAAPRLSGPDLVGAVPGLGDVAELVTSTFGSIPSPAITESDVFALRAVVRAAVTQDKVDGVVVTQGTDTLEETAYLLDLLHREEAPVVVTGAMRHPGLPGADGPANLLSAVRVAASPAAKGLGALVVFNDQVHAARYVQKTHTSNVATFQSRLTGPLGWVSEGDVRIPLRPGPQVAIVVPDEFISRPVALVKTVLGDDGRLLDCLPSLGYCGAVVEGFGGGHVSPAMALRVADLRTRMPVVLASRTGSGEGLRRTYDTPGSELDLIRHGVISAGALDGVKARILLTVLLMSSVDDAAIRQAFEEAGTH